MAATTCTPHPSEAHHRPIPGLRNLSLRVTALGEALKALQCRGVGVEEQCHCTPAPLRSTPPCVGRVFGVWWFLPACRVIEGNLPKSLFATSQKDAVKWSEGGAVYWPGRTPGHLETPESTNGSAPFHSKIICQFFPPRPNRGVACRGRCQTTLLLAGSLHTFFSSAILKPESVSEQLCGQKLAHRSL